MRKFIKKYYNKVKNKSNYFFAYFILDFFIDIKINFNKLKFKSQKKTFIFILSGGVNKSRIEYLFNYYYKNNFDFLFYSDYTDIKYNVIKTTYSSTYSSGELKHVNILNFVSSNLELFSEYENFFFIDDDTFVNVNLLEKCMHDNIFSKSKIYGQLLDKSSNPDNPIFSKFSDLKYLSGGAGYIVHKSFFENNVKFKNYFTGFSDSSFGLNINNKFFIDSKLFNSQDLNYYSLGKNDVSNFITFHYIKNREIV